MFVCFRWRWLGGTGTGHKNITDTVQTILLRRKTEQKGSIHQNSRGKYFICNRESPDF